MISHAQVLTSARRCPKPIAATPHDLRQSLFPLPNPEANSPFSAALDGALIARPAIRTPRSGVSPPGAMAVDVVQWYHLPVSGVL
jgi:hypothetical protein